MVLNEPFPMRGANPNPSVSDHCRVSEVSVLQAVSCPLVEGVKLQDSESILQLLCAPSQHRTDILTWICCRYTHLLWTSQNSLLVPLLLPPESVTFNSV